MKVFTQVSF